MIITSTEQAKEGELVQLRKGAALVKGVAEKAEKGTQSVPMGKKEEIQEEVVKEEKGEETEVKAEEDIIDVKNVAQVLPLRRSARAARMAIVKVDQVEFSDPFFLSLHFYPDQVEVRGKGRKHLRVLRGLRGSEELELGEEDSEDGGESKVTTVSQVEPPPLHPPLLQI